MTTAKQIEANRRNAQKSTGPRTPPGKAASRLNAATHGLTGQTILLPGEDPAALNELRERVLADLRLSSQVEAQLAEHVIGILWRLQRLSHIESGMFAWEIYGELASRAEREAQSYSQDVLSDLLESCNVVVTDKEAQEHALAEAQVATETRHGESLLLGCAFSRDASSADAFTKLSRYQTSLERSLFRTLQELQEIQVARGENP